MLPRLVQSWRTARANGVWLLAGCAATHSASTDPEQYRVQSNARFAEHDIAQRLFHQFAAKHPDARATYMAAFDSGKRIVGPRLVEGSLVSPRPNLPPTTDLVWVLLMIDRSGNVAAVECVDERDEPLQSESARFVHAAVAAWHFSPATADGEPIMCGTAIPVRTDGRQIYGSLANAF
jgi:hypothetical protein